ncbi:MAG: hypothetical protein ACXABY_36965 [Candidatus Thorarchaeota archaeon]
MTDKPTLEDLPDEVFVALGRRGMEGIPLKECTYECDGKELTLLEMSREPEKITGSGIEMIRYVDGKRMDTKVNLLDDEGNDLGWLGSY